MKKGPVTVSSVGRKRDEKSDERLDEGRKKRLIVSNIEFRIFHLLELDFLLFRLDGAALVALVTMDQPIPQFLPNQFPR